MNISGSSDSTINGEYYYIRNAQGDIIGLADISGTQVVTYTYDIWGKLISIEGSKKDTVGLKNPYRYRGYRYDTETGLYYLQSRYYNPEWGRFINEDVLMGQTGELLSHNLFSYCKNNPVNMSDPTGFRPTIGVYNVDGDYNVRYSSSLRNNLKKTAGMVGNNIANGGIDKVASTVASKYISTGLKYVELGTLTLGTYVEKNPIGSLVKTATGKIGVSSFIGVGISVYSNIKQHGWTWGAAGRIGIDTFFVVGAVAASVLIPGVGFTAAVMIGVGAESLSRGAKNIVYGDKFWD